MKDILIKYGACAGVAATVLVSPMAAQAASITVDSGLLPFPVPEVDGSSSTLNLSVLPGAAPPGSSITDVNVFVDFTKCDDPISANGECRGQDFSFNDEIILRLLSPLGTVVNLVNAGTYGGSTPGQRVGVTFDDAAASLVGGIPVSGTFRPVGSLANLVGESPFGSWTLFFEDTFVLDPLSVNRWSLNIETTNDAAAIPTPALLPGLIGMGVAALRKKRGEEVAEEV